MTGIADWKNALLATAPDLTIANKVLTAIQQLFDVDADLLIRDLNERTITGNLTFHMRPCFPEWHVDCEFNRDGHEVKKADGRIVVPDIIVHHRGTPENLLVIEVKKSSTREPDEEDLQKLRACRDSHLRYSMGLFLKLIVGENAPGVSRIQWM